MYAETPVLGCKFKAVNFKSCSLSPLFLLLSEVQEGVDNLTLKGKRQNYYSFKEKKKKDYSAGKLHKAVRVGLGHKTFWNHPASMDAIQKNDVIPGCNTAILITYVIAYLMDLIVLDY